MLDTRGVAYQEKSLDLSNEQDEDVKHWRSISDNMLPLTLAGNSKVKGSNKWELIGLLGENFGDKYLTQDEKVYFSRHFDTGGSPVVVLYGTSWCPGCAALRKDFQEHGVSYVDIDVERSGEFDKLTRVMEIPGYPATWVGYTRVHGTTFSDIKAVMNNMKL
jgi:glutaredoxin